MVKFRQKQYTQWDETDRLKQMRDSDILAEKKKSSTPGIVRTATGASIGAVAGATIGGITGLMGKKGFVKGLKSGAKWGGVLGAAGGFASGSKQRSENEFYNDRLKYAQRQALRREKKDWKNNMTNREGYTY